MGGGAVTFQPTSIPSRGSSNIPSRFVLQIPELSAGLMHLLARMQTLPFNLRSVHKQGHLMGSSRQLHRAVWHHITSVILFQHFLLGVKFVLAHVIPDVPQWVQDEMARQQYKAQLALRVCSVNQSFILFQSFTSCPSKMVRWIPI